MNSVISDDLEDLDGRFMSWCAASGIWYCI